MLLLRRDFPVPVPSVIGRHRRNPRLGDNENCRKTDVTENFSQILDCALHRDTMQNGQRVAGCVTMPGSRSKTTDAPRFGCARWRNRDAGTRNVRCKSDQQVTRSSAGPLFAMPKLSVSFNHSVFRDFSSRTTPVRRLRHDLLLRWGWAERRGFWAVIAAVLKSGDSCDVRAGQDETMSHLNRLRVRALGCRSTFSQTPSRRTLACIAAASTRSPARPPLCGKSLGCTHMCVAAPGHVRVALSLPGGCGGSGWIKFQLPINGIIVRVL